MQQTDDLVKLIGLVGIPGLIVIFLIGVASYLIRTFSRDAKEWLKSSTTSNRVVSEAVPKMEAALTSIQHFVLQVPKMEEIDRKVDRILDALGRMQH